MEKWAGPGIEVTSTVTVVIYRMETLNRLFINSKIESGKWK